MSRAAYLILENGTVFEGKAFGAEKETTGELVFTTAMTGYLETLTDPSYYGQVVIQTFPLIGNYGVIPADFESDSPSLKGYIVREWCQVPSNFRCEGDLDTFLKESGIPGIYGIDTRALTRIVREYGVLNCKISYSPDVTKEELDEIKNYVITEAVESTTIKEKEHFDAENGDLNVVLMDFGAKHNIGRELVKRGCNLTVVPAHTTADEIKAMNPDGVMLSNGPGDPSDNTEIIAELKKLCDFGIPILGICLGHQAICEVYGATIAHAIKLMHGKKSDIIVDTDKKIFNGLPKVVEGARYHSLIAKRDTIPDTLEIIAEDRDGEVMGVKHKDFELYGLQFHPESILTSHGMEMIKNFITLCK